MGRQNLSSKQFWVSTDDIMKFAEVLEESELNNCMVGPEGERILMDVDYDANDIDQMRYILELQKISDGEYEQDEEDEEDEEEEDDDDDK